MDCWSFTAYTRQTTFADSISALSSSSLCSLAENCPPSSILKIYKISVKRWRQGKTQWELFSSGQRHLKKKKKKMRAHIKGIMCSIQKLTRRGRNISEWEWKCQILRFWRTIYPSLAQKCSLSKENKHVDKRKDIIHFLFAYLQNELWVLPYPLMPPLCVLLIFSTDLLGH